MSEIWVKKLAYSGERFILHIILLDFYCSCAMKPSSLIGLWFSIIFRFNMILTCVLVHSLMTDTVTLDISFLFLPQIDMFRLEKSQILSYQIQGFFPFVTQRENWWNSLKEYSCQPLSGQLKPFSGKCHIVFSYIVIIKILITEASNKRSECTFNDCRHRYSPLEKVWQWGMRGSSESGLACVPHLPKPAPAHVILSCTRQDQRNELGGNGNQSTRASSANHTQPPVKTAEPSLCHCITPSLSLFPLLVLCFVPAGPHRAHCSSFFCLYSTVVSLSFSLLCPFIHWLVLL